MDLIMMVMKLFVLVLLNIVNVQLLIKIVSINNIIFYISTKEKEKQRLRIVA